ncbi:type IIB DNA topoisomerase [Necator americanus]|uniref:DNA topoisomerase (ATP-hydrolyzing) n=1 Tax=Necator americanus TaxID=51031 RepID=W2T4H3_NECAM|nr:type IIB DNA topoisomerase [Necator americanus]ETN75857.1 type IIB DNA topoisomerase [Necator americanus]
MSVSSSSLKEEDLTCKQKSILRKIEFICLDLVKQLSSTSHSNKIILRASEDDAHKQIVIFPRQGMRLAFIMQSLARIYQLITNGQQSTKRDLYYDNKKLYKNQGNFDRSISTICDLLDEPRVVLNIISSSRGIISGALAFLTKDKQLIDCRNQQVLISEYLMDHRVVSEAQFIIVVEKHAMFEKMIDEGFFECFPKSVLVTGKGYPDICTRQLLRWLVDQLAVPVYGLFDSDPHGIA